MQKPNPLTLLMMLASTWDGADCRHSAARPSLPGGAMAGDVFGCLAYGIIPHGQNHDVGALLGRPSGNNCP